MKIIITTNEIKSLTETANSVKNTLCELFGDTPSPEIKLPTRRNRKMGSIVTDDDNMIIEINSDLITDLSDLSTKLSKKLIPYATIIRGAVNAHFGDKINTWEDDLKTGPFGALINKIAVKFEDVFTDATTIAKKYTDYVEYIEYPFNTPVTTEACGVFKRVEGEDEWIYVDHAACNFKMSICEYLDGNIITKIIKECGQKVAAELSSSEPNHELIIRENFYDACYHADEFIKEINNDKKLSCYKE